MAYIGNPVTSATFAIDTFNGNGVTTNFTLREAPVSTSSILVFVGGVRQATDAYTLSSTTLIFSEAPPSGTNNIQVLFLGLGASPHIPSDGSVTTIKLQDGSVTAAKLAPGAAQPAANSITTSEIANGAVQANNLAAGAVTGDKIGLTAIRANNIADSTITAAKLAPGAALSNGQLSVVSSAIGVIADSSSGSGPYKILGQIQPTGNTLTTIYTVPASTNTVVTTITICNQSANVVSVNVAANVSGSAVTTRNFILTGYALNAAETLVLEPRISLNVGSMLSANITGANASSNISINAFGVEII